MRNVHINRLAASALCAASAIFLCGASSCKSLMSSSEKEEDKPPKWVISINEVVKHPRGADGVEKQVPAFDGRPVWVNNNHYLGSKAIEKVELVPIPDKPEYFNLKLTLDRHGTLNWIALSGQFANNKDLAVLIDGMYYRSLTMKRFDGESEPKEVTIEGPFDVFVAKKIVEYAPRNYKFFHPDKD